MGQGRSDESTLLQHGGLRPAEDELPPDIAEALRNSGNRGTETQFSVAAIEESDPSVPVHRRPMQPAPARQRPTLLPAGYDQPPKLPDAPREADPALMRPVRPSGDPAAAEARAAARESSDVIQVYDMNNSGEPRRATLHPMAPARTAPPAVAPPQQPRAQVRKVPTAPPTAPPRPQTAHPAPPAVLPLDTESVLALIAAHRGRLHSLDNLARFLEVGAGILGTAAAGFLIATLVGLLVSTGNSLIGAASALVIELIGLGVTVGMLAMAASMRHLASMSSQLAALLEALSQSRR